MLGEREVKGFSSISKKKERKKKREEEEIEEERFERRFTLMQTASRARDERKIRDTNFKDDPRDISAIIFGTARTPPEKRDKFT